MSPVCDFVWNLAVGGHLAKEILSEVDKTFGKEAMKTTQVYQILSEVKNRGSREDKRAGNPKKTVLY